MSEFIDVTHEGPVAKVTIDRPEVHNAFNDAMINTLTQVFQDLGQHTDVRVIILGAVGKTFSAGADLNWMKSMIDYTVDENIADANRLATMLRTIRDCPKPVIGRIHGATFGGGVGITSVCDMTVAVEKAKFCLSEVKLGLLPAVISPFVLEKMPRPHASRYFLTAERFSAHEAKAMGLVSEVVSDEKALDETIAQWVSALVGNGPEAVTLCKQLIKDVCEQSLDSSIDLVTKAIAERRASAEGQEGMRAFLDKRSPNWVVPEQEIRV